MFFFKKKKQSLPETVHNTVAFDKAFEKRLGQDPVSYVTNKLASGSDIGAIRQLFDILAAEVELRDKCKCPGFDIYYEKALSKRIIMEEVKAPVHPVVTKEFAISQLIGKERFVSQYHSFLSTLALNHGFMQFVKELRMNLAGIEITDTKTANKRIADYFYINKANEKYPEVKAIVEKVLAYGKQASAHISIYYAMFLFEE